MVPAGTIHMVAVPYHENPVGPHSQHICSTSSQPQGNQTPAPSTTRGQCQATKLSLPTATIQQQSITGWAFCYTGAAITYKSKLQTVITTSSTKAEFVAAVHVAKSARYL